MDNTIYYIKIEDIIPSKLEPHLSKDDGLEGLTISIQNYGIIQPLLLRKNDEKYEIVLGNRRYKAAVNLGLKQVPAIVLKLNDKQSAEYIILDNIQRKDLNSQEKEKLFQDMITKFNIDKSYISNNLGINFNSNQPQSHLFNKEERFKSSINIYPNTKNINQNNIIRDVINLKDLNNKELEREDFNMNNEPINNNIVNTNVNNIPGVTPTNNTEPTFGGRFFPSLEDEQTNMDLNNNIVSPPQTNSSPILDSNPNPSPLIDLTDLGNEPRVANKVEALNPQLEPIPNIASPNKENLSTLNSTPSFNQPPQPTAFEQPQPMPNIDLTQLNNQQMPSLEIPNQNNIEQQPQSAPFEIPQTNIPTPPTSPEMPNINPLNQQLSSVSNNPPVESKDITPAINTIKSIVDTISSLGYKISITENETPTSAIITLEVQK